MDGSMNQPNHGQPNFAAYQQGSAYDNMNLSPQPGDTIFADLNTDDVGSPLFAAAGGDTNNNNAMDALTAAAVAAKPATPQGGPQQIFSNNTQPKAGNSTPLGKVVETGQEHTGRWTKEEHDAFLTALQLYGKEWKKVAARVKTRTVVQTRTHAQKYFQKLQRVMEQGAGAEGDLGVGGSGITLGSSTSTVLNSASLAAMIDLGMGPSEKKSKKRASRPSIASTQKQQKTRTPSIARSSSGASAANTAAALLNNMSNDNRPSALSEINPAVIAADAYTTSTLPMSGAAQQQQHGFGFVPTHVTNPGLSIIAPTHEDMVKKGGFPEPSPAACGSRKMAEIAAAQMLAGVVGASVANTEAKRPSVSGTAAAATAAQAVSNGALPSADTTPFTDTTARAEDVTNTESKATEKPTSSFGNTGGRGLALQIVNPDTLTNDAYWDRKKRSIPQSPITPWDGQLEALVSHVKQNSPTGTAQNGNAAEESVEVKQTEQKPSSYQLPLPLRSPQTALQAAICKGSLDEISQICAQLSASNSIAMLNERNDAGYHPFHFTAALGLLGGFGSNSEVASNICRVLIDSGADVTSRDKEGNTPVHWAARAGHSGMLNMFLSKSCPLDAQNDEGETALHWAMRAGMRSTGAVKTLVENGAIVNVFNLKARRPLDVAAEGFEGDNIKDLAKERRSTRWNLMRCSSQCRTLVLHHQECLDHLAKSDHDWEVPDRIGNIMSTLANRTLENCGPDDEENFNPYEVTVSDDFERATLELLSRIHSAEYLSFVNDLSKELERKRKQHLIAEAQSNSSDYEPEKPTQEVVPFTPMVQRKILKEEKTKDNDHSDTAFSVGSLKAARRAAGAVQHAVDCVLVGRNRNAFCVVRPPGHHAGINGLLSDAESCGFCLFNNVAAGAMHALSDEKNRPRCQRCAIVDIDAHHGNGTEEIVRKCHDSGRLLFFSVHLFDHDKPKKGQAFQYKFYPGTGAEDDVAHNIINVPIAPLWREKEVVKSISLASNGLESIVEPRKTRQRTKELSVSDFGKMGSEDSSQQKPSGGLSQDSDASATESTGSSSSKPRSQLPSTSPHYPPHYLMGTGRLAYRRAIQHRLLPALRAFNPDLIILSTGLDAARGDVGNARHYNNGTEAMGFDLEPEDYAWTARKVCEVADICCQGRVVSVLEGGYGRTPSAIPAPPLFGSTTGDNPEMKRALDKSFFSECAIQHLKGLVDPYLEDKKS
ncbi:hypothetical protein ACHAWT_007846 [Skeletonema menzelii]